MMRILSRSVRYVGGAICTLGGVYLGNAYGASYWRFEPFNLAWDTLFRGSILLLIGFMLIKWGK